MSIVTTDNRFYSEIAAAIREKNGESTGYLPADMAAAILAIKGGGDAYAAISVTYPEGSICTCSQAGQDTLTAGDDAGTWLFVVPVGGTWTVTATQSDKTSSQIVSVSEYGQVEHITLLYRLWLFKDGDQCTDITGGWTSIDNGGVAFEGGKIGFVSSSQAGRIRTKKTIPAKRFKELHISIATYTSASWIIACMGAAANITPGSSASGGEISWTLQRTAGVQILPISDAISDAVFFAIGGYQPNFLVDKIWLE